jgi:type VI secretion system secreted protein VgrG
MPYTQAGRLLSIETPLGKDALLLHAMNGVEGISRLFHYDLDLLAERPVKFPDIIGKKVTVSIVTSNSTRYINGYVNRFAQTGADDRFLSYRAEVVPWLWMLTRTADCRIFQKKSTPEIIKQIFADFSFADFELNGLGSYEKRDYCVQYRETAFNYVSRLMEEEGIFYFFRHDENKHVLVLADSSSAHKDCPSQAKARFEQVRGTMEGDEDVVTAWNVEEEFRPGKYSHTDYNFEDPATSLLVSANTTVKLSGSTKYEIYDYPGAYKKKDHGDGLAKVRMQEIESDHVRATGSSTCRGFSAGYRFGLAEHPDEEMNKAYVLTEVQLSASVGTSYSRGEDGDAGGYSNHFSCIPFSTQFRPPRITPKPRVDGPQTAIVVGPSGEEIYTDNYGRVKVQFYWDRLGKKDENSSCWVRVSQPWGGKNWGAMWIPRIGQEVIVEHLEGDPDAPLITGRVYNAIQMPPYTLPDHHTVSTFMSRSSKGGGSGNYNEMRFEDKKGSEQIFVNAEKDMDLRVENDSREFVGANHHLIVTTNQTEQVGADKNGHVKGNHLEKIDGDMSLQVGGDQSEKVGGGYSLQVGQAIDEKVGTKRATEAGQEIHLKAGMKVIIEAGMQISLKGPGGFVDIGPAGVTIQGTMVLINSGGSAGSGSGASPKDPKDPKDPDTADDGSKFGKC